MFRIPDTQLSAGEVVALSGITYRQLDHWAGAGYIPGGSPGSGYSRCYSRQDTLTVMRFAALVHAGFRADVASRHMLGTTEVFVRVNRMMLEHRLNEYLMAKGEGPDDMRRAPLLSAAPAGPHRDASPGQHGN